MTVETGGRRGRVLFIVRLPFVNFPTESASSKRRELGVLFV